jgi:YHS domain-containing protein
MKPSLRTLLAAALLTLAGCEKGSETTNPDEAGEVTVVKNVEAQPGDTTTCPFSGRTFVVKAEHPKVEYQGATYWICSEDAAEKVRADPGKYLDDFEG